MSGVSASGGDVRWSVAATSDIVLMDVAPAPVLAALKGLHDRVPDRVSMRPGMPHGRRIAAADVPARQAQPQVHPRCAEPQTFLTAVRARAHLADRRDVWIDTHGCHDRASFALPADSAWSSQLRSAATGAAPACRAHICPWSRSSSVGTACTANRCEIAGALSTST